MVDCKALAKDNIGHQEGPVAANQWRALYVALDEGLNDEQTLALFEALYAESNFRNLGNPKVPKSMSIPHDAEGTDHDSVGVLQQRVNLDGSSRGWGTVEEAMDPDHAMRQFAERAKGSSKRGKGAQKVAQEVQNSAFSSGSNYLAKDSAARDLIGRLKGACGTS